MTVSQATVLVVDDEPELLEIFSIWLRRNGASVLKAPNGAEAMKLLTTQTVHALVSDIRMPVMDGVTLVRTLHDAGIFIPSIIFVSGFGDVSARELYSLGVEAMLPKPLGRNQLVETLARSLRDREELWLEPASETPLKNITLEFSSLQEAKEAHDFALGRGGCCVRAPRLSVDAAIAFYLHFSKDDLVLIGQGTVRWYDARTGSAGIEFCFLDPASRQWVIEKIRSQPNRSFIPNCD